jgi:hypothetical protein
MGNVTRAFLLTLSALVASGCGGSVDSSSDGESVGKETQGHQAAATKTVVSPTGPAAGAFEKSPIVFADLTAESGLDFYYYGSPSDQAYMTEQNGGGVAIFDADGDCIPDVFLANGSNFDSPAQSPDQSCQFYFGRGSCTFENATVDSGLQYFSHGMGVTAGDFDNDGFTDLFVACFGRNALFQNQGDGTFRDVLDESMTDTGAWSCSPAFADLNGDGLLDLYVVNYVAWTQDHPPCSIAEAPHLRRTCSPTSIDAVPDELLVSQGDGTFVDVGQAAGIADRKNGKGLALGVVDVNSDGLLDVYVANDNTANSLFINEGGLKFSNDAVKYGVAVSADGVHGASMGVGISDFDRNGHQDLFVTNFRNQVNDLYASLGDAGFVFANTETGIDLASRSKLAFGTIIRDFNGDSWPDIFIANGHIWDQTSLGAQYEYRMFPSMLLNQSGQRFVDVASQSGDYFRLKSLGRAVATGDLDNDADLDLVVQHLESPAKVLRNDSEDESFGVLVRFVGTRSARQPLGCRVEYQRDGKSFVEHVASGESFQASQDPRIVIPGRAKSTIDRLQITWPDGHVEHWSDINIDRRCELVAIEGGRVSIVPLD